MNQPTSKRKRLTPTTPDKPKSALKPAQEPENPSAVTVDVEAVEVPEMTEEEQVSHTFAPFKILCADMNN
ncbi:MULTISPECIES: hypothetical protein [unclassified Nostoc]|uniref:hypothetical protein n=1 Tax=unclassified Nostoc TaxID=2593658 RepID=UPI002FFD5166